MCTAAGSRRRREFQTLKKTTQDPAGALLPALDHLENTAKKKLVSACKKKEAPVAQRRRVCGLQQEFIELSPM